MNQNLSHEFEQKKLPKKSKCGDCKKEIKGSLMSNPVGAQCRNCLTVFCPVCVKKPTNQKGCGSTLMQAAPTKVSNEPDPVMDFYIKYVKRNAAGEMVVRGLPPEFKQLFKDAGVKPKELKDPKTASWLIGLMNDILAGKVTGPEGSEGGAAQEQAYDDGSSGSDDKLVEALFDFAAVQPGDLDFKRGDVIKVLQQFDNGWAEGSVNGLTGQFPFNYVKELPPEPKKTPPPVPVSARPAAAVPSAPAETNFPAPNIPAAPAAPKFENAQVKAGPPPPAPPPAPMAVKSPAPPPPPSSGSKPGASSSGSSSGGSSSDLGSAIALGVGGLKKAADRPPAPKKELAELTVTERNNMLDIISAAMNARRKDIDEDDEDGDDDWDDED